MNTLPIVFTFMFLLALTSGAFLKDFRTTQRELKTIGQFYRAEKNLCNKIETSRLPKKESTTSNSSKTNETQPSKTPYKPTEPRESLDVINDPDSKLNITELLKDAVSNKFLQEVTIRLLNDLYRNLNFFQEDKNLASKIVEDLIKEAKINPIFEDLTDLYPKDPKLREVFYYLLRGTKSYSEKNKKGYPPLSNYLTIDKTKKGAFCFQKSSKTLLNSFFGEECSKEILQKEREKSQEIGSKYYLKTNEVKELLLEKKSFCSEDDLKKYVRFGNSSSKKDSIVGFDEESPFYIKLP